MMLPKLARCCSHIPVCQQQTRRITKNWQINSIRSLSSTPHNLMPRSRFQRIKTMFLSYLEVRKSVLNGGYSFNHNFFMSFCLTVVKARVGSDYTVSELLEGSPDLVSTVTELIQKSDYAALSSLCVKGPGRDASSIEKTLAKFGHGEQLQCNINGPAMLEALHFDIVGWEGKSFPPFESPYGGEEELLPNMDNLPRILWTTTIKNNLRIAKERGWGESYQLRCACSNELMIMASIWIPATIKMVQSPPSSDQEVVESDEVVPDGCRIIIQSNINHTNELNWKLVHVDMGVLRISDVDFDKNQEVDTNAEPPASQL
jgi:hypothetical protein